VNLAMAKKLGLGERIAVDSIDFNLPFPAAWTGKYDAIYSVEVRLPCNDARKTEKRGAFCLPRAAATTTRALSRRL
jgi:hypothetical protein